MLRLLLAAALSAALLATVLPAVDDARTDRTASSLSVAAERLDRAGRALSLAEDATADPSTAPRRSVAVSVPARSWTAAAVRYFSVGGPPDGDGNRSVVVYAAGDGPRREHRLSVPVPVRTPDGPVVVRGPGRRRVTLTLSLVRRPSGPVVTVGRPG